MSGASEPLVASRTLFTMNSTLILLVLIVINHGWVDTHALDHTTGTLPLIITVLIMKFFDKLKQIVIYLGLISFRNSLLFLSINLYLGSEDCLTVWLYLGSATSELLQGALRDLRRHH